MEKDKSVYVIARQSQTTGNWQFLMSFDIVGKHVEVINVETTRDYDKAYKFSKEQHLARHICANLNDKYNDGNEWQTLPIGIPTSR